TFGAAVHMLGLSLGFTLIMGIVLSLGSMLPLSVLHPEKLSTSAGSVILSGIGLAVTGVILVGYAGILKGRARGSTGPDKVGAPSKKDSLVRGIATAVLSGITSASLNLGFAFSAKITDAARQLGNPGWSAGMASWQLLFWGGFITCGTFCSILLVKNRTWHNF